MINPSLHRNLVALDREKHCGLRLDPERNDLAGAAALNSFFVSAAEFAEACKEYPIVFVNAGTDPNTGLREVAPLAVFGLVQGENLFLEDGRWKADYIPAALRLYPFAMVPVAAGSDQYAVCIDESCAALSRADAGGPGELLFGADGEPTPYLKNVQHYLELLATETKRTRAFCRRLAELDLLREMRFDATLPDGNKLSVDGFLAVDDKKLAELPDRSVLELHRNGMLGLLHVQRVSLGNMQRLVARRLSQ